VSDAKVFHAHLWGTRKHKYAKLRESSVALTDWTDLEPQSPFYLLIPRDTALLAEHGQAWSVADVWPLNTAGIVTARDHLTIHFSPSELWDTVCDFAQLGVEQAREKYDLRKDTRDWKVHLAQADVKETGPSRDRIAPVLYRPFDIRYTYYTGKSRGFLCMPRPQVMPHVIAGPNLGLVTVRKAPPSSLCNYFAATRSLISNGAIRSDNQSIDALFVLYAYPQAAAGKTTQQQLFSGSHWASGPGGRVPNLSPEFVAAMAERLGLTFVSDGVGDLAETFGPEDVFHYIYAVFHAPTYRERYAEFLKIDFPRVPLTSDLDLFRALCGLGADLVALHLLESEYPHASWNRGTGTSRPQSCPLAELITTYPVPGDNTVAKGHPKYLAPGEPAPGTEDPLPEGRVYMSKDDRRAGTQGQYFEGVPPEVWAFHIGGYQVCGKWLKDRRGRQLSYEDLTHYQRVVVALHETIRLMSEIDAAIDAHGGWPIE